MSPELRYTILALVSLLMAAGALFGMVRGWRRRVARPVPAPPGPLGGPATAAWREVLYVATSLRDQPLERVAVPPLGHRGRADLVLRPGGLDVAIRGERPFGIPAGRLAGLARGTATIDRVVERGGLSVVFWTLGEGERAVEVESAFRIVDRSQREDFARTMEEFSAGSRPGPEAAADRAPAAQRMQEEQS